MVSDAEKFKEEDEAIAKKVQAKNGFENYCFQMKNTLDDEKLKAAFTDDDKKVIQETSAEGLQWLEGNQDADAEVIEGKQKTIKTRTKVLLHKAPGPGARPRKLFFCRRLFLDVGLINKRKLISNTLAPR